MAKMSVKLGNAFSESSKILECLLDDLEFIQNHNDNSEAWKRNYIRVAIAFVESVCFTFRNFGKIYIEHHDQGLSSDTIEVESLSSDMIKVIEDERLFNTANRIKHSLKLAHIIMCDDETATDFSTHNWTDAKDALQKRDHITHPSSCGELVIDGEWEQLENGIKWLIQETTGIYRTLHSRSSLPPLDSQA